MKPQLLIVCCLLSALLSGLWFAHDVHYLHAYRLSTMVPVENFSQEALRGREILKACERASNYGLWRGEVPFFRAKVCIEWGRPDLAQADLILANRIAPNAWWVKALNQMMKEKWNALTEAPRADPIHHHFSAIP